LKTRKRGTQYFLVIVPHRDSRLELRKWSDNLFNGGFYGAYLFPWLIPAALLSAPFNPDELKHCACVIREATLGSDGKIHASDCSTLKLFNRLNDKQKAPLLFGLKAELEVSGEAFTQNAVSKVIKIYKPLVIGSCMLSENEEVPSIPAPKVSFRAAAIAVMSFRFIKISEQPENAIACRWKILKLHWLPSYKKGALLCGKKEKT
jgi:hypothetical protein